MGRPATLASRVQVFTACQGAHQQPACLRSAAPGPPARFARRGWTVPAAGVPAEGSGPQPLVLPPLTHRLAQARFNDGHRRLALKRGNIVLRTGSAGQSRQGDTGEHVQRVRGWWACAQTLLRRLGRATAKRPHQRPPSSMLARMPTRMPAKRICVLVGGRHHPSCPCVAPPPTPSRHSRPSLHTCSFSSSLMNSWLSTSTRVLNCCPICRRSKGSRQARYEPRQLPAPGQQVLRPRARRAAPRRHARTLRAAANPAIPVLHVQTPWAHDRSSGSGSGSSSQQLALMKVGPSRTRPSRSHTASSLRLADTLASLMPPGSFL